MQQLGTHCVCGLPTASAGSADGKMRVKERQVGFLHSPPLLSACSALNLKLLRYTCPWRQPHSSPLSPAPRPETATPRALHARSNAAHGTCISTIADAARTTPSASAASTPSRLREVGTRRLAAGDRPDAKWRARDRARMGVCAALISATAHSYRKQTCIFWRSTNDFAGGWDSEIYWTRRDCSWHTPALENGWGKSNICALAFGEVAANSPAAIPTFSYLRAGRWGVSRRRDVQAVRTGQIFKFYCQATNRRPRQLRAIGSAVGVIVWPSEWTLGRKHRQPVPLWLRLSISCQGRNRRR